MALLRKILICLIVLAGVGTLGLVSYSYFFVAHNQDSSLRGETAVNTSQLIVRTGHGTFIDKRAKLTPDMAFPYPGSLAPELTLSDLLGQTASLSSLRGKPVLLNFWATWCPPCRVEIPDLQKFYERYGDRITVLGIDYGETSVEVTDFLKHNGITYVNLMDPQGTAFVDYRLTGVPTSFFIDAQGIIRGLWQGPMTVDDMVAGFEKTTLALGGP
jgi:thiol-disulfide isomerase/thioredoxin